MQSLRPQRQTRNYKRSPSCSQLVPVIKETGINFNLQIILLIYSNEIHTTFIHIGFREEKLKFMLHEMFQGFKL